MQPLTKITVNLGPQAEFFELVDVVNEMHVLVSMAARIDAGLLVSEERSVDQLERSNRVAVVERVSYSNPLELVLATVLGGLIVTLVTVVRDWGADRQHGALEVKSHEQLVAIQAALTERIIDEIGDPSTTTENAVRLAVDAQDVLAVDSISRRDLSAELVPPDSP